MIVSVTFVSFLLFYFCTLCILALLFMFGQMSSFLYKHVWNSCMYCSTLCFFHLLISESRYSWKCVVLCCFDFFHVILSHAPYPLIGFLVAIDIVVAGIVWVYCTLSAMISVWLGCFWLRFILSIKIEFLNYFVICILAPFVYVCPSELIPLQTCMK